jgi:hypothetical protein
MPALRISSTLVLTSCLAACAGTQAPASAPVVPGVLAPPASAAHRGWLSPQAKAGKHLLYIADQFGQTVYIFPQKGKNPAPIGAITEGVAAPDGLFVDRHNTLYVCNFGAATITEYPLGVTSPSKTLTGAGVSALDVAVGRDGTVYVADFAEGANGHVFEYAHGSTTPTTTIDLAGYPEGLALDRNDNLFVAYQAMPNAGTVLEYAKGSTQGTDLQLPIVLVGGAAIDAQGNLLVVDQSNPNPHVDVFAPGSKVPTIIGGFDLAFDIALNKSNARLYVSRVQNPAFVYEVAYPKGTIVQQLSNTIQTAYGVATSPDGAP